MRSNRRNKETSLEDTKLYDRVTQTQTFIIEKLYALRKSNKYCVCSHFMDLSPEPEKYQSNENYYAKFWKLYLSLQLCREKIKVCEEDIEEWQCQLQKISDAFDKLEQIRSEKIVSKPKTRRKSDAIQKKYSCRFQNCYKSYGTQPALRLHEKQKHNITITPLCQKQSNQSYKIFNMEYQYSI